ncbi:FtsK/SpoIIIE domain-containing protein [Caldilinea sp.]|uniref:FtsK/SpoIIIE domain-containing protein n=1 Tax=Caldilinea sp. TaxID=2293560 RepID=UPI0021DDE9E1|nr:FtsK/SpoIIIE domain-containing protein [Caldilinea sp.]GIV73557.1 MAG: hypothetical protein KatS3mg049_2113 [Caldilinea sp.]
MSDLLTWIRWVESRIAAVAIHEQLYLRVVDATRGPMTVTFTVRLLQPSPAGLRRVLNLGPALAQALQVDAVRVADTARGIHIEIPSPAPRTPTATWLAQHTHGTRVAVGMDSFRHPVVVDLADYPSLLFVGPTRKGKTEAAKSVLYALLTRNPDPADLSAIVVGRRSNWACLASLPGVVDIIGDHETALEAARWLSRELHARHCAGQAPANRQAILFVVDDLPYLLQNVPEIADHLGAIAGAGGAVGMYQLIITHFAGSRAGTGGQAVDNNITARILYRPSSKASAALSAGTGGLGVEHLSGAKGDALLILDGVAQRVATAHLPPDAPGLRPTTAPRPSAHLPWRAGIAQNGTERPHHPPIPAATTSMGEGGETTCFSRSSRSAAPPDPGIELVERLRATLPDARPKGPLLPSDRPPSPMERAALRYLHDKLGSKERVYPLAWGFKNRKTWTWLDQALKGNRR